jgi:hypothetical protein
MMTVLETFQIKGRGTVIVIDTDWFRPGMGAALMRADGSVWTISGVETQNGKVTRPAALLVSQHPAPGIGDQLEWFY